MEGEIEVEIVTEIGAELEVQIEAESVVECGSESGEIEHEDEDEDGDMGGLGNCDTDMARRDKAQSAATAWRLNRVYCQAAALVLARNWAAIVVGVKRWDSFVQILGMHRALLLETALA